MVTFNQNNQQKSTNFATTLASLQLDENLGRKNYKIKLSQLCCTLEWRRNHQQFSISENNQGKEEGRGWWLVIIEVTNIAQM
jgi:hypothetical protein